MPTSRNDTVPGMAEPYDWKKPSQEVSTKEAKRLHRLIKDLRKELTKLQKQVDGMRTPADTAPTPTDSPKNKHAGELTLVGAGGATVRLTEDQRDVLAWCARGSIVTAEGTTADGEQFAISQDGLEDSFESRMVTVQTFNGPKSVELRMTAETALKFAQR